TCPEDIGDTGEPTVFDDACSLIGVTYEDTRFDFVDGACFKILREWAVIDWCQYDSQTGAGLWHYTQVIKVHDSEGPEFEEECVTQVLCVADAGVSLPDNNQAFLGEDNPLASSCSVHLNFERVVHETCSDIVEYDVKIYPFNGTEYILIKPTTPVAVDSSNNATLSFDTRQSTIQSVRLNGIPYNSQFCGDYHRILWTVEDGCGNFSTCEYLFRLEDCKLPSPVCINGLSTVVMPIGGEVTVWAKDFNASSFDDCTPAADLLYSFSGDAYEPSHTYTCDNVPAFNVEIATQIWVADGGTDDNCNGIISWNERNKDYCTTTIVITDNGGACEPGGEGSILAGEVLTEDVLSVAQTSISLNVPGHVFPTYVTTSNGQYSFTDLVIPSEFSVNAERNDAHRNGVSTLDLVKIQKHLLGIELLDSPYDLIAADANNSENISAIDLIELRKLILGIYVELPANKSWRFVDKNFQFGDVNNPWPFSESINMSGISHNELDKDFIAIKVGDVNNTVQANANQVMPRNGNGVVNFVTDNRAVTAGQIVDVAISSADFAAIEGYQFTMQTNGLEFRGVSSGIVSMTDENFGVFGNTLTASWNKVGGVNATSSDVLFTLSFEAKATGQLCDMMSINSKVTEAEAYNTSSDIKDLKLTFRGSEHDAEFALYQNEPNPFKGNTVIGYDLPVAGNVVLTIFDVAGKVLVVKEQESVKGYNTITVSSKDIPSTGVLYYRLDANEYTASKKMVIIE
ncbi:MAG TPA: T9SS type A sorting domain-containing protein, partial [Saprospiraceae bacterium]